jgi:hypothetical protein
MGCSDQSTLTDARIETAMDPGASDGEMTRAGKKGVVHQVSVGGADICEALGYPTGCDANFSLTAHMKADGTVKGQWQDTFSGGGAGIHVDISCLNVVGNSAMLGGMITHGKTGDGTDISGKFAYTAVADNGTSKRDPADQISFSYLGNSEVPCEDLELSFFTLVDLKNGQVKVQ